MKRDTNKRLNKILEIISQEDFLENRTKGGELSFFIFDYDPEDELTIRDYVKTLIKNHTYDTSNLKIVELDLFDLTIQILKSEKVKNQSLLELIPEMELKQGTRRLENAMKPALSANNFSKYIEIIKKMIDGYNIIFITGVGKVWPIIRSHNILNNLHHVLDKKPVIMFYPGNYDQKDLKLFSLFKDDNYYRAFKLVEDY